MMSQRTPWSGPQNLKNNTGFGVIRIQVASKSTRAPLAGSDRPVLKYRGTGTAVLEYTQSYRGGPLKRGN